MKKLYALAFAAAMLIGCGGGDSVTGSSPIPDSGGGFTSASVQPSPSPSPATPSSTPEGDRPYVTFKEPLGEGEFCNTATHQLTLTVEYWNANNFQKQQLLETRLYTAQAKTCIPLPPAAEVVKLTCGEKVRLQIDAATTEHLGHVFVDLQGPEEKETVSVDVSYTEWSACTTSPNTTIQECSRTRKKITTTTKTYVCKAKVVEEVVVEEKEPCKCPCVEQWSGSFTVKADTHENGQYAYRVCTKKAKDWRGNYTSQCNTSNIVWQGWIAKGSTYTKDYPVNNDTLYVQVNLDSRDGNEDDPDSVWEGIDESTQAKCGELKQTWNEDISFNCKQVCK